MLDFGPPQQFASCARPSSQAFGNWLLNSSSDTKPSLMTPGISSANLEIRKLDRCLRLTMPALIREVLILVSASHVSKLCRSGSGNEAPKTLRCYICSFPRGSTPNGKDELLVATMPDQHRKCRNIRCSSLEHLTGTQRAEATSLAASATELWSLGHLKAEVAAS